MNSPATTPAKNPAPISVVVADKSSLVRVGLRGLLEEDDRFELVALAADGAEFLELIDQHEFQVAVIGWAMPGVDGRGVLRALREKPISARIVVYTGHANQDVPRQVMALGGAGFCWKSEPPSQLLDTVAAVAHGQMVFPYVDVRALHTSPLSGLTARERELLEALSQGSSNAKLAADFKISVQTVKFHLKNVYGKLGTANRAQAAALYVSAID